MKTTSSMLALAIAGAIASTPSSAKTPSQDQGAYRIHETRAHGDYDHRKHASGPATVNQAPFKSES